MIGRSSLTVLLPDKNADSPGNEAIKYEVTIPNHTHKLFLSALYTPRSETIIDGDGL